MLESSFGGDKPKFEIEEEEGERRSLKAEYLSDLEQHSKISSRSQRKILEKTERIKELNDESAVPQTENELNILRAGIQNIATREILTQESGPTSIRRQDFLDLINSTYPNQAEELFNEEIWSRGIQTAARAIEIDLRKNDGILNKEVIFIDEIDANNATDYVFTGCLPTEDGSESVHVAKLVQVGNSLNYKTPEEIREQHFELAEKLRNRASYPHSFEEVRSEAEQIITDIITDLDQSWDDDSGEDLAQLGLSAMAQSSFYPQTIEKIRQLSNVQQMKDQLSEREYNTFKDQMYVFALLAEDSDVSNERIEELVSDVIEAREDYGIRWIDTEESEYVKDLLDRAKKVVSELVSVVKDRGLKKEIPYKIISKISVRHDTYAELPESQREVELGVDNDITAMYDIDQNTLLEIVEEVINRNL